MFSTNTASGGSPPTAVHAKPQSPPVPTWQAPRLSLLPVSKTVWPLAKHHRVLVLGSSFRMIVVPWAALKTMLGFSQHHHHHGKISRIRGSANFEAISAVRALSGFSSVLAREPNNPTPVMRSAVLGCLSGAMFENATCGVPGDCTWIRRSTLSITANKSNSHHHGQQCHQKGQHGHQQNRDEHQLKVAVKLPSAPVGTVMMAVSTSPLTPLVTL